MTHQVRLFLHRSPQQSSANAACRRFEASPRRAAPKGQQSFIFRTAPPLPQPTYTATPPTFVHLFPGTPPAAAHGLPSPVRAVVRVPRLDVDLEPPAPAASPDAMKERGLRSSWVTERFSEYSHRSRRRRPLLWNGPVKWSTTFGVVSVFLPCVPPLLARRQRPAGSRRSARRPQAEDERS